MALLKCKMCGGDLNIAENTTTITCEYCGTVQTVPMGNDEEKSALFNRANDLRMKCEFDKASGIYESIITKYPNEAEGYWGLVLCKFGIEYVDDVRTGKKIPTCHRTNPTSIMDDSDFERTCENADVIARDIYRAEAKAIDQLQKQIISVVEKEDPYDVFICYKETDDVTKAQTEDSKIAQDIYTALLERGYKVFFARQTLKSKAGTEYEPYIYAALSSSKVMLAIGTNYNYYDAVWVKNEWGRFLRMMANDPSKHLIPCFKNLDAYDIPKEFKNLQALDIADTMFSENLMRNIERFVGKGSVSEQRASAHTSSYAPSGTQDPLLKRAFLFLEDGDWTSANEYCEKVLDSNPENANAYLGKLMSELRIKKSVHLANVLSDYGKNPNYLKALRFGDERLKAMLTRCLDASKAAIERKHEDERLAAHERELKVQYENAKAFMLSAKTVHDCNIAAEKFHMLGDYKDSSELAEKCIERAELVGKLRKEYNQTYPLAKERENMMQRKSLLTMEMNAASRDTSPILRYFVGVFFGGYFSLGLFGMTLASFTFGAVPIFPLIALTVLLFFTIKRGVLPLKKKLANRKTIRLARAEITSIDHTLNEVHSYPSFDTFASSRGL